MTDFDKRSFIPTPHTLAFITQSLGESLNSDWLFYRSDQTGGMVMCDVYVSAHDSRVLVIGEDGVSIYPDLFKWENIDGLYDYEDTIGADFEDYADVDFDKEITAYPDDNYLPALWILAQLWSWEKYQTIIAGDIPDDHRAVILAARTASTGTTS